MVHSPLLSAIHVYPVKSARGVELPQATVEPWGLADDRRWMLTDMTGRCVTQREYPRLALVEVVPRPDGGLWLNAPGAAPLELAADGAVRRPADGRHGPARPLGHTPRSRPPGEEGDPETIRVRVWGDEVEAVPAQDEAHSWFSRYLGAPTRLVHLDDPARRRPIDPQYAASGETVSFADGFPLLLTTTASLAALENLITEDALSSGAARPRPLPMNRFRPSVVIEGTAAWAEDGWRRIHVGEVTFRVVKPCGRCVVTTIDQDTGERDTGGQGTEPLRTLSRYRRFGKRLVFGQNLVPEHQGTIRVGDPFTVLS